MTIKLAPQTILGHSIAAMRIGTISANLDEGATVPVTLHRDADEASPTFTETVPLGGKEYSIWGTDDGYVVDVVCKKLGLEKG
jgi:hypothetical protein